MPMELETDKFVDEYCKLLVAQFDDAFMQQHTTAAARNLAFHQEVARWHCRTRQRAWNAMVDLNTRLPPGENDKFVLRDHVLTSGVGSLNGGFLLLTANPGHSGEPTNRGEVQLRESEQQNVSFGAEFFSVFPLHVQRGMTHGWWRRVLRVVRRFYEPQWNGQHTPQERWAWANGHGGIGCVDLFPFHSPADGLSRCVLQNGQAPEARAALLRIADTTLDMAIRARPKVLFIASLVGANLVTARGLQPVADAQIAGRALQMYCIDGIPVFTYAGQLFSGRVRGITNDKLHCVADAMRQLIAQHEVV